MAEETMTTAVEPVLRIRDLQVRRHRRQALRGVEVAVLEQQLGAAGLVGERGFARSPLLGRQERGQRRGEQRRDGWQ